MSKIFFMYEDELVGDMSTDFRVCAEPKSITIEEAVEEPFVTILRARNSLVTTMLEAVWCSLLRHKSNWY